jgi:hypothetical protein
MNSAPTAAMINPQTMLIVLLHISVVRFRLSQATSTLTLTEGAFVGAHYEPLSLTRVVIAPVGQFFVEFGRATGVAVVSCGLSAHTPKQSYLENEWDFAREMPDRRRPLRGYTKVLRL